MNPAAVPSKSVRKPSVFKLTGVACDQFSETRHYRWENPRMKSEIFVRRSRIEAPSEEVFDWHARSGAFQRLTPPWETVQII